jgi:hypothetical protein
MSQSKNISYEFGALSLQNFQSLNGARIINVGDPISDKDAVNKSYVDNSIHGSNLIAGVGVSIVNNNINVVSSQTQISALGTIQTGVWNSSTIQIPYGGTGQTTFNSNKLLWYSGNNSLNSAQQLTFDTTSFVTSVPIYINDTTDITNLNDTIGSLIVGGGAFIKKKLHVLGNALFEGGVTVGNLTINGNISLASINAGNANYTSITTSTLNSSTINVSSYLVSPLTSTNNLLVTNATINNAISNFVNVVNCLNTNITTTNVIVTGLGIFNSMNATSISTGLISSTNTSTVNLVMTNISGGTVRATTFVNTPNLINSNATISSLLAPIIQCNNSANIFSLTSTTGNITSLIGTNSNFVNNTNTNLLTNNITTNNLSVTSTTNSTSFSGSSMYLSSIITVPNIANQNTTITNLTSQNSILNFASIGSMRVSGVSNFANMSLSTATASNVFINSFLTSTFNNFVGVTVNNLNCTSFGIFSTVNSSSVSTGTLFSNESVNLGSSIGTLNVTNNINNSNGNIYTSIISASNLYSSLNINGNNAQVTNFTTNSLNVNNVSILGTVLSQNTSTGTLLVSGLTQTLYLVSTNQTNTNLLNTNISTSSARINTMSVGNSFIVNSSVANTNIINTNIVNESVTNSSISNLIISSNATFNKNILLGSTYAGGIFASSGSFLNVLPSFYTNNVTISGGVASTFFANYIAASTLIASNPIITNKATNLYIQSNVILGANQNIPYNSSLALGYVNNTTGGNLNYQIAFERSDNNAYAGVYIENTTNKLTFVNASINSGINMFTTVNSPLTLSNIPSSTNITPTAYAQFNSSTSNFYSTTESTNLSSGSVVLSGGLSVNKTILTTGLAVNYQSLTPVENSTVNVSSNISGVVLTLSSGLTNLTIILPITNVVDGKILFITTNKNITNVTLNNAVLQSTSMSGSTTSLRFLFVNSQSLWYSI